MNKDTRNIIYFFSTLAGALLVCFTNWVLPGALLILVTFIVAIFDGD